jgi:hypothetical protein
MISKDPKSDPSDSAIPTADKEAGSVNGVAKLPDPIIVQAKRDLDAGLVDTDMRATPGLDAKRRVKLVHGAAGKSIT